MEEIVDYKISQLGTVVTGKTPSSHFPEEFGNDMPFITPTDFKYFHKWADFAVRGLSKQGIDKLITKVLPPKSILVTCIGSDMGKVAINKVPVITNQQLNSIIPDSEIVNSEFLYYKLVDSYDILRMHGQAGTAVPIVNKGDFENIVLGIPKSLTYQGKVAELLSELDNKVDLLMNQINTLEKLCETLFRQWFIEEAITDEEVTLQEYVNTINGYSYKSSELNPSENALVTLKSFNRNGSFRLDGFKEFTGTIKQHQIVKQGDLIVSHTDITQEAEVIGNPALVIEDPRYKQLVITMDMVKVVPKDDRLSIPFLYFLMRTAEFKFHCLGCSNGTTVLHMSKSAIPTFSFPKPDYDKVKTFTEYAGNLLEKTFKNHAQIRSLNNFRDTILPKLMSGEATIKE